MPTSRRSFLKRASGVLVAAVAPLYIPADRLGFGVPRPLANASASTFDGTTWTEHGLLNDALDWTLLDRTLSSDVEKAYLDSLADLPSVSFDIDFTPPPPKTPLLVWPDRSRMTLQTRYPSTSPYVIDGAKLGDPVDFIFREENTVTGVIIDWPDGSPYDMKSIPSISVLEGDTIQVRYTP